MKWEELQNEPSYDLIEYMKYKDHEGYKVLAQSAFVALTFRFRAEVIDKCRKVGRRWGYDAAIADTIAEQVFERFWKYPFGFKPEKCRSGDPDICVQLYLYRIARNCFYDHHKAQITADTSPYDGTEEVIVEFPAIDQLEIPEERLEELRKTYERMEAALATLSPKHRTIYLTYKAYEKEGFKLPRLLLKRLREELELSQNSIRVYKNEAFHTIEQYLKDYESE